jgi:hypothetical protein
MTQARSDDRGRHTLAEEDARVGVAQRMERHALQSDVPHQFCNLGTETIWKMVLTSGMTENQIFFNVVSAEHRPFAVLLRPVLLQDFKCHSGTPN